MNTEPPTGDELQQLLVSMKRTVLERAATQRPKRRRHRAGVAIGIVVFLAIGGTSGALALGMVPQPFAASAPTPTPSTAPSPATPSTAPIVETPEPASTPSDTPARPAYTAADPSTWTITADGIGPVVLGSAVGSEQADATAAFGPPVVYGCPGPNVVPYGGYQVLGMDVLQSDGVITDVVVKAPQGSTTKTGPTTATGISLGSTLDELRAAYPGVQDSTLDNGGSVNHYWSVPEGSHFLVFRLGSGTGTDTVDRIWVASTSQPDPGYCT